MCSCLSENDNFLPFPSSQLVLTHDAAVCQNTHGKTTRSCSCDPLQDKESRHEAVSQDKFSVVVEDKYRQTAFI